MVCLGRRLAPNASMNKRNGRHFIRRTEGSSFIWCKGIQKNGRVFQECQEKAPMSPEGRWQRRQVEQEGFVQHARVGIQKEGSQEGRRCCGENGKAQTEPKEIYMSACS